MSRIEQLKPKFFQESAGHVRDLEAGIARLACRPTDQELLEAMFRAAHSVKGGAGIFGFYRVADFAQSLESVLDHLRQTRSMDISELQALRSGIEVLGDLLLAAETGISLLDEYEMAAAASLLRWAERLAALPANTGNASSGEQPQHPAGSAARSWDIDFEPSVSMLSRGGDPIGILRQLKSLGTIRVAPDLSGLKGLRELLRADATIRWQIRIDSVAPLDEIQKVFEPFSDEGRLGIKAASGTCLA